MQHGGRGWVRHFAFPVCFPLVAVPWLVQFENVVIQGLAGAVTFAAVEIAGWIGVGAYQIGNIIELHNGFVGVDDACSGVKTLQASIMVALVLGELFLLRATRRIGLLVVGCALGVCLQCAARDDAGDRRGEAGDSRRLEHWHDPIGTAVLIVGMAGLVVFGWLLREKEMPASRVTAPRSEDLEPARATNWMPHVFAIVWLVGVFAATEFWYRSHERELSPTPRWHARWPADNANYRAMPIADSTRAILRYDAASSAAWEEPRAIWWWGFFAHWRPHRTALQLVRSHSPEICLPAAGRTFVQERPAIIVDTEVLPLRLPRLRVRAKRSPALRLRLHPGGSGDRVARYACRQRVERAEPLARGLAWAAESRPAPARDRGDWVRRLLAGPRSVRGHGLDDRRAS